MIFSLDTDTVYSTALVKQSLLTFWIQITFIQHIKGVLLYLRDDWTWNERNTHTKDTFVHKQKLHELKQYAVWSMLFLVQQSDVLLSETSFAQTLCRERNHCWLKRFKTTFIYILSLQNQLWTHPKEKCIMPEVLILITSGSVSGVYLCRQW